ncbi:hypothetical protein PIB30_095193, partial [Stylosanthes scabra]|nr:hypothetical protein [Stylosanthes scabra]
MASHHLLLRRLLLLSHQGLFFPATFIEPPLSPLSSFPACSLSLGSFKDNVI